MSLAGMALKAERVYSLEKIVYVFFFFFMGVVPLNDLNQNNLYWGGTRLTYETLIITNFLVIVGLLSFFIGGLFQSNKSYLLNRLASVRLYNVNRIQFIIFFLSVSFIILYVFDFNIIRLLFRGVSESSDFGDTLKLSQIQDLVFNNFLRPAPIMLLLIFHYVYSFNNNYNKSSVSVYNKTKDLIIMSFVFLGALLLISPTSVARFLAATLYIPFILVFTKIWNKPYRMQFSIIVSLLVIMPFLEKFRYFDPSKIDFSISLDFLNHGHFDAYQNFARVVDLGLVTNGYQLSGVLLFFVPRSFWPDKPVGSGYYMSEIANYSFSNISMPYIGEGYVNFGVLGVLLFMLLLGISINKIDAYVWNIMLAGRSSILIYYYYILFGLVFFIMRGDLLSSFAFTVGISLSFWAFVLLIRLSSIRLS
ncbi:hypothetical protein ACK35Y_07305 [Aeromonas veronii]